MRFPHSLYPDFDFPDPPPRYRKHGHVGPPGTGPKGETCGSCVHIHRRQMGKVYLKCGLNKDNWTGGGASDIRAGDPACNHWQGEGK